MNLGEMIDNTRRIVVDAANSGARRFTDPAIVFHLNETGNDFAFRTRCTEKACSAPTVIGQREYSLPDDVVDVRSVIYDQTGDDTVLLPTVNTNILDTDNSQGSPGMYAVWGDKIVLDALPTDVKRLNIRYWGVPTVLSCSDPASAPELLQVMEIPARYHFDIVIGAVASIMAAFEDTSQYSTYKQQFEQRVAKARTEMTLRMDGDPMSPFMGDGDVFFHSVPDISTYDR